MKNDLDRQTEYCDRVAWDKEFSHPLDDARFLQHVAKEARILDVGCGYALRRWG